MPVDNDFPFVRGINAGKNLDQRQIIYGGFLDKIPFGAAMNKALTFKMGQTHMMRYMKPLLERIERGEIDRAASVMSQGFITRAGIDNIKESLRQTALWIKNDGGIRSIKVLKEDTVGDVAEVTVQITRGGGDSSVVHYRLIREQGEWKVDAIVSEPTVPGAGAVPS